MSVDHAQVNLKDRQRLLAMLMDMCWHNPGEMRRAGGVRHSARLLELKRMGFKFADRPLSGEKQGKEYILLSLVPTTPQKKRVKILLSGEDTVQLLNLLGSGVNLLLSEVGIAEIRKAYVRYLENKDKL